MKHWEYRGKWKSYWRDERLDESLKKMVKHHVCVVKEGEKTSTEEVDVCVDELYHIFLNSERVASLTALPTQLEEMAVGHLVCEGFLPSPPPSLNLEIQNNEVRVITTTTEGMSEPDARTESNKIRGDVKITGDVIFSLIEHITENARLWRRTGGTHSTLIADSDGKVLFSCEDVSRHTAMDKAVGYCVIKGIELSECVVATTCRLSEGIVRKVARIGIPIIVSKAAPLSSGIEVSEEAGITIVAFVRRPNLYIYTHPERVLI
ncbi:formate dehydrogenase accessory sulfurtransferase FdhD [Methanosarcinales archaeon]|nr:MAG: formate dehydrogenase accessory sulfurtransferase FdhD [Methanosarcinales archaeon]